MTPIAGILCLRGWQPYTRRYVVGGHLVERPMLVTAQLVPNTPGDPGERFRHMVMGWPEVMDGSRMPGLQLIPEGTLTKEGHLLEWEEMSDEVLTLLSRPIIPR